MANLFSPAATTPTTQNGALLGALTGAQAAPANGLATYQSGITAGPLAQANINQYGAVMNPSAAHTDWPKVTHGVSPAASQELNNQQLDAQRAQGLSNQSEYYRQAALAQAQMQNQFNAAQSGDILQGYGNLLGQYRNNMTADMSQQNLNQQLTALLTQLASSA